jgi:hypothetical protein
MHRNAPRLARTLACAAVAVPVLLASAACSSSPDSGGEKDSAPSASPSASTSASAKPSAITGLPNPCKTVTQDTLDDVVPDADPENGKNLPSEDTDAYGSCFWHGASGKLDGDYRSLTVSLKRYESAPALGSGDDQAGRYFTQQVRSVTGDKTNDDVKQEKLDDLGSQAVSLTYTTVKDSGKEDKQKYRAGRVLVRVHNAVVMVDYEGTGFEDAELPDTDEVRKNAQKAAEDVVAAVK